MTDEEIDELYRLTPDRFAFARAIEKAEREACAKVCLEPEMEFFIPRHTTTGAPYKARPRTSAECAAAIRARSNSN